MGVVYRARDLLREQFGDPQPHIAIKLLSDDFKEAPDADLLLYSEFALTRHLRHPNVVRVDAFEVDPVCRRAFITQEFMPGKNLDALLCERPNGLTPDELQTLAIPMLDALAHVHHRGVIHGDLKPGNLMLTEEGPRLFDFGLGQAIDGALTGLPRLSRDRFKAWTPCYAAPELLEGGQISTQTDVFAMACVLYEMACGKHPFSRMLSTEARTQRRWYQLSAPQNLPLRFWPAIRLALALDVKKRTISAQELYEAFRNSPLNRMQFESP
jgi:serine/threonine-protein kinase Stk1